MRGALYATRALGISHENRWKCSFGVQTEALDASSICSSTRGGGDLVSCILPMQDINLRRTTGPHIVPSGSRIRTPLLTPNTGDARFEVDTHHLHPVCSNYLLARRSMGCLAPPLSCFRDLWQHEFLWLDAPASAVGWSNMAFSDRCSNRCPQLRRL